MKKIGMQTVSTEAKRLPLRQNVVILFTLGFGVVALLFSYSAQYIWGMEPCRLCKLQRLPYFFVVIFSGLAFLPSLGKVAVRLIQVSFLVSLGLACYHLLVIAGVVADSCSVPTGIATIEDFQRMLEAPLPCSKTTWKVLSIPIAGYNVIASTIFLFGTYRFF